MTVAYGLFPTDLFTAQTVHAVIDNDNVIEVLEEEITVKKRDNRIHIREQTSLAMREVSLITTITFYAPILHFV